MGRSLVAAQAAHQLVGGAIQADQAAVPRQQLARLASSTSAPPPVAITSPLCAASSRHRARSSARKALFAPRAEEVGDAHRPRARSITCVHIHKAPPQAAGATSRPTVVLPVPIKPVRTRLALLAGQDRSSCTLCQIVRARRRRNAPAGPRPAPRPPSPPPPPRPPARRSTSERWYSVAAASPVARSTVGCGETVVGIGFMAARSDDRLAVGHAALDAARRGWCGGGSPPPGARDSRPASSGRRGRGRRAPACRAGAAFSKAGPISTPLTAWMLITAWARRPSRRRSQCTWLPRPTGTPSGDHDDRRRPANRRPGARRRWPRASAPRRRRRGRRRPIRARRRRARPGAGRSTSARDAADGLHIAAHTDTGHGAARPWPRRPRPRAPAVSRALARSATRRRSSRPYLIAPARSAWPGRGRVQGGTTRSRQFSQSRLGMSRATGAPMVRPVDHAAQDLHLVLLDLLAAAATIARLAAGQVAVDHLRGQRQTRGQPLDDGRQRRAVRFPGRQKAKHSAPLSSVCAGSHPLPKVRLLCLRRGRAPKTSIGSLRGKGGWPARSRGARCI